MNNEEKFPLQNETANPTIHIIYTLNITAIGIFWDLSKETDLKYEIRTDCQLSDMS